MTVALRDRRRRNWFWGEKSAIERLETDAQVAVYVALLVLSGEGSLVWASQATIAGVAHCSTRTVARVLPELERLGVCQRAGDETLKRLSERLAEVPGTVVYELVSVEAGPGKSPEPRDDRGIMERLDDIEPGLNPAQRKKAVVAILRKWMSEQTGREVEFPWLIKLYDKARGDETVLVSAAQATVNARPQGSVLGYMTRVLAQKEQDPVLQAHLQQDLSNETQKHFGGW